MSKLGDYRYDPAASDHTITINENLNQYAFLITLVHEIAHQHVRIHHKRVQPHGSEWKMMFRDIMLPFLKPEIFPADVLNQLIRHMRNPKASSSADHKLSDVLSRYDLKGARGPALRDLSIGSDFKFRGREYALIKHRRTRSICEDKKSGRRYLIPMNCKIQPLSS